MNNKRDLIKGNCKNNKNHKNNLSKIFCYTECGNLHYNEFNGVHKTISNDIDKVLNNKNNNIENKKIDAHFFEKIKSLNEFIEINNMRYFNEIKENKNITYYKYSII